MGVGIIFSGLAGLHLFMLFYGRVKISVKSYRSVFLFFLLFGLVYDNVLLSLGNILVGTDMFHIASLPRFILHACVLPFLALFSLSTMQFVNVPLSRNKVIVIPTYAFTALALLYGVFHELPGLELGAVEDYGLWRMTNMNGGPPLATIAVNIVAIIMGAFVWRVRGVAWLFVGALFAFVLNTLAAPHAWSFVASNMVEVVFVFCLLKNEIAISPLRQDG